MSVKFSQRWRVKGVRMLIIGERINATRSSIKSALGARDADFIKKEALAQAEAGAGYLDLNAGTSPEEELDNMNWLCQVVQESVEVPLCIDSASAEVIEAGLKKCQKDAAMVNSISMEKGRHEKVLPLVKEYDSLVVALAMDDSGIPRTAEDRLRVVERIAEAGVSAGVPLSHILIDPLVMALSADTGSGLIALQVISGIRERWPELKTTCGLSNISFGLPNRRLVNRTFLTMLMAAGLDSAIVDPLDAQLMAAVISGRALRGEDEFCMDYLKAYRAGRLEV